MPARSRQGCKAAAFFTLLLLPTSGLCQQITPAPNGLTAVADGVSLQVNALRDDILRVRMWRGDAVPEDASWAVLADARTSSVPVTADARRLFDQSVCG